MPTNEGYTFVSQVEQTHGLSLAEYLAIEFPHSTLEEWKRRIAHGEVRLNQGIAGSTAELRAGDTIAWHRPGWEEADVPNSVDWLYEDEDLLVVSKPSGLPTLPGGGFLKNTLLGFVHERDAEARPLHRLGRATSGLVLFARNKESAHQLTQHWSEVTKTYWALADGIPLHDSYRIDAPIGRCAPGEHPRLEGVYRARANGKNALSLATVLERHDSNCEFSVVLKTGRPHQIRIHLATIGHPLVGDPIYAIGGGFRDNPGLPGDPGYQLHAWKLNLRHPRSHQELEFAAPLPRAI